MNPMNGQKRVTLQQISIITEGDVLKQRTYTEYSDGEVDDNKIPVTDTLKATYQRIINQATARKDMYQGLLDACVG